MKSVMERAKEIIHDLQETLATSGIEDIPQDRLLSYISELAAKQEEQLEILYVAFRKVQEHAQENRLRPFSE